MPRVRKDKPAPLTTAISFTLSQGEQVSGLSRTKLRRLIADGQLESFKLGGTRMIKGDSLRRMLGQ
jgi:hypothetical protein